MNSELRAELDSLLRADLAPHLALNTWISSVQRQIDVLGEQVTARVSLARTIRREQGQEISALNTANETVLALTRETGHGLSLDRATKLLDATQQQDEHERVERVRQTIRQPVSGVDRPGGGPVLIAVTFAVLAGLTPLTGHGALAWPLLALALAVIGTAFILAAVRRRQAEAVTGTLRNLTEQWKQDLTVRTEQAEQRLRTRLNAVGNGEEISQRVREMDLTSSSLEALNARDQALRIGYADLSSTGEEIGETGKSARGQEAAGAVRRLQQLRVPLDLPPGNAALLMLSDEDDACATVLRLAPGLLPGLSAPLYRIDFRGGSFGAQLDGLSLEDKPRPTVTRPQEILDLLVDLSTQARRDRRVQRAASEQGGAGQTTGQNAHPHALLVVFGVPAALSLEGRSALFDLLQDGPSTGLNVLMAVSPTMIAQSRRWSDLEPQMLVLYPEATLPDGASDLLPGQWWAQVGGRPVAVDLIGTQKPDLQAPDIHPPAADTTP